jgi:hypothetical protein
VHPHAVPLFQVWHLCFNLDLKPERLVEPNGGVAGGDVQADLGTTLLPRLLFRNGEQDQPHPTALSLDRSRQFQQTVGVIQRCRKQPVHPAERLDHDRSLFRVERYCLKLLCSFKALAELFCCVVYQHPRNTKSIHFRKAESVTQEPSLRGLFDTQVAMQAFLGLEHETVEPEVGAPQRIAQGPAR